jgi:hypothetical protein
MPAVEVDYYALLAVDPGADAVTIRKALVGEQRLWGVRQNAPDLATRHAAERRVQLLAEVRDILLDPSRRALYDVRRVPVWPTGPEPPESLVAPTPQPAPRGRGAHRLWPTAAGALAIAVFVLVLLVRGEHPITPETAVESSPTLSVPIIRIVPARQSHLSTDPPPQPVAPTATVVVRAPADDSLITLSGTPQSPTGGPVASDPFALAAGRYIASWSLTGQPPCGIVIALAEPTTTGPASVVLVNHVLKQGEGQLAQGQTSIVLSSGRYRLDVTADACAWSLLLKAGPPG